MSNDWSTLPTPNATYLSQKYGLIGGLLSIGFPPSGLIDPCFWGGVCWGGLGRLAIETAFEILKHFLFDFQTHFEMLIFSRPGPEMANNFYSFFLDPKALGFSSCFFAFLTLIQDKPGTLNNQFLMDGNGETTIFYVMVHHPIETTISKQMFQVPGMCVGHFFFSKNFSYLQSW